MRREGYEILEGLLYYSTRGFAPVFSLAKSGDCVLSTRILTNRSLGAGAIIFFYIRLHRACDDLVIADRDV